MDALTETLIVEIAPLDERTTVAGLMQRYLPEVAEHYGHESAGDGRWRYGGLDLFWHDDMRHAFLFKLGRRNVGFALVRQVPAGTMLVEFYIAPDFRHRGHGTTAALEVFKRFPGKWAVREAMSDAAAQEFFRSVVRQADRSYSERIERGADGRSYVTQGFVVG